MRYVNRRRLFVVVVLAVLFGAALPYAIIISHYLRNRGEFATYRLPIVQHGNVDKQHRNGWMREDISVYWNEGAPTPEVWNWIISECDGLLPGDFSNLRNFSTGSAAVWQYGWPFRAVYQCHYSDPNQRGVMKTSSTWLRSGSLGWRWLESRTPYMLPVGIKWRGVFGNVGLSVLLMSIAYCGLAHWRARRSIKRGECYKCGYLSKGAPVCPECGTAP